MAIMGFKGVTHDLLGSHFDIEIIHTEGKLEKFVRARRGCHRGENSCDELEAIDSSVSFERLLQICQSNASLNTLLMQLMMLRKSHEEIVAEIQAAIQQEKGNANEETMIRFDPTSLLKCKNARLSKAAKAERQTRLSEKRMTDLFYPQARKRKIAQGGDAPATPLPGSSGDAILDDAMPAMLTSANLAAAAQPNVLVPYNAPESPPDAPTPATPKTTNVTSPPGKKTSPFIYQKLEVLRFHDNLSQDVTAKEKITMAQFPDLLKTEGMLGRWRRAAGRFHWEKLSKQDQQTLKEIPNHIRSVKKSVLKGQRYDKHLPIELQKEYDKVLSERVEGTLDVEGAKELLQSKNVIHGMKTLAIRQA